MAYDPTLLEASADVTSFCDELTDRLPPLETFSEEKLEAGAGSWS